MPTIKQQIKSKTNACTVIVGAILSGLPAFGIDLGEEATAAIMMIAGILLRQITNESLSDK